MEFVEDVVFYELMKLCILNGGYVVIVYFVVLFGYYFVYDVMVDLWIWDYLEKFECMEIILMVLVIFGVSFDVYFDMVMDCFLNGEVGDIILRLCFDGLNC